MIQFYDLSAIFSEDPKKPIMLIKMLYNSLDEAVKSMERMLTYVDEYFAERHDFYGDIIHAQESLDVAKESIMSST